jgi:hypothetical protein
MTEVGQLNTSIASVLDDGLIIRATARRAESIPVELSSFEALFDNGAVELAWQTQSETNNAGFAIEQRRPGDAFRKIGFVDGAGTTDRPQNYRYRINDLPPGPYDFRLRQVDHDGSSSHSAPVAVQVEMQQAFRLEGPTPHPVRHNARFGLAVEHPQRVTISLVDLLGRRIHTYTEEMEAHRTYQFELNAERLRLPSGRYFLRANGETFVATEPLTVVR